MSTAMSSVVQRVAKRTLAARRSVAPSNSVRGFSSMMTAAQGNANEPMYAPISSYEPIASISSPPVFLDTLFSSDVEEAVGFQIPQSSVLRTVGSTPITEIDRGVWTKLEGYNFSGSIKDRAMLSMILKMFEAGTLKNGSTITLTTSGSAGISLALIQKALAEDCGIDLNVIIIMPKAYEQKVVAQKMVGPEVGVPTFYDHADPNAKLQLLLLDGIFMDVMQQGKDLAARNGYSVLDQHFDINSMLAHKSTAMELITQMPDITDVVCATGTGATAGGLRTFLPDHITVHSRASESGKIDGLSDISRYDNFCNENLLEGYRSELFNGEVAKEHQRILLDEHGLDCGMSSGATMWLARKVKAAKPEAKVAFISACGQLA